MNIQEIPLSPDNQTFSITINGVTYSMRILWRASYWVLDLLNSNNEPLVSGIPMVTGTDLLSQYRSLGLEFSLAIFCDDPAQEYPTETDLGITSHLYIITE